jgi:hypothetical protein
MVRVNSSTITKKFKGLIMCYLSLFCSLSPNRERREERVVVVVGGGGSLSLFVGRVNPSTSGDERQLSILTLIHSLRALVGVNTVFALQLYLR